MINREWQTTTVNTYSNVPDSYGQAHTTISATRSVPMVVKFFSQSRNDNPLYNDVSTIGITKDRGITTADEVVVGATTYQVLHTIPSGRYCQILMKAI